MRPKPKIKRLLSSELDEQVLGGEGLPAITQKESYVREMFKKKVMEILTKAKAYITNSK